MIEDIKLLAAYATAYSEDKKECCAIAHSVMNKALSSMGESLLTDTLPALEGEEKEKFFKILSGKMPKDLENSFKSNLITASAVLNGNLKDETEGSDSFSKEKTPKAVKIGSLYFSKSQPESVISETKPSKRRKKKEI